MNGCNTDKMSAFQGICCQLLGLAYLLLQADQNFNLYSTQIINQMSKVNFKPLADRVLVEPAAAEEKTASGIIIPDTAKEKPQRGEIVAIGTGKKDEPLNVKVGDQVLYGKYSGTEITIDGKEFLIMKESDIYGIV